MIVRHPTLIEPGQRTPAFGYVMDIAPTLLELTGTPVPDGEYQGRPVHRIMGTSMLPLLRGESDRVHPEDEVLVYELAGGGVWQGDYSWCMRAAPWEIGRHAAVQPAQRSAGASGSGAAGARARGIHAGGLPLIR